MLNWYWAEDDVSGVIWPKRHRDYHSEGVEQMVPTGISGLGHGERRRSLRFVADFASVGPFSAPS